MPEDIDLYRIAVLLVDRFGEEAALQGSQRMADLLANGEVEDSVAWRKIIHVVEMLLQSTPRSSLH